MAYPKIQNHPYGVALAAYYDKSTDGPGELEKFVAVSVALTGFSEAELESTGLVRTYFEEVALTVGRSIRRGFLEEVADDPTEALTSPRWLALGQNLIRMWYVGQWKAMPGDWAKERFGEEVVKGYNEFGRDSDRIVSPTGYQEGLVWRAIGVNPPGAKQPGFASWTRGL